jgi:hypothetical protein
MPDAAPPRVFISYSHDSPEHQHRVLVLADRLRVEGVDASIDQYVQSPQEGWADWCETEIRKSDFVLMVCTETYLRRVNHEEEPGKGYGVLWEARLIRQHLYDQRFGEREIRGGHICRWLVSACSDTSERCQHPSGRNRGGV